VVAGLLLVLAFLLVLGDKAGQPLSASLTYQPEGAGGLPQVSLTFHNKVVPVQAALEGSFEITPNIPGDFGWKDSTLLFSPAVRLESDTLYRVRVRGGLKLIGAGRSAYEQAEWSFRTRPARIAFLKKEGQAINLWITGGAPGGSEAQALTFETRRQVLDFTVSPGGERLIYSLSEPDGLEASLWLVKTAPSPGEQPRRLLYEPAIRATAPRWSPGGDVLAYERRLVLGGGAFSQPQLWLIQPDGTSLAPLYGGSERYGTGLNWATGGSKAFFWEPNRKALGIFNFGDEPAWKPLPGVIPQSFSVSPDGRAVILARYDYSGPTQRQFLDYLTLKTDKNLPGGEWQVADLPFINQGEYNAYSPGWSPKGKLAAFLRESTGPGPDRETRVWLFEPESGKTWPLVADLPGETSQGGYQWSPDGQKILYEQFPSSRLKAGSKESEIWEISYDGTAKQKIASGAFGAKWVY
jgi:hypothetical protein